MFTSVHHLEEDMGVDPRIGRFFVDRKLPENNSFWKKRHLYIAFGNGFNFIPVYYDMLRRIGLPVNTLLEEQHILFMEQIMHLSTLHELNEISFTEELQGIRAWLTNRVKDQGQYEALNLYFDQPILKPSALFGLPYPALNRADAFLYILCDLPLNEQQFQQAVHYWYALLSTYLAMDDIRDYIEDKEKGEENVILELGDGTKAFEKAYTLLLNNIETLSQINPPLSVFLKIYTDHFWEKVPENIS